MLQVRVMNSTSQGKVKIYAPSTTIADIMSDPDMSGILVGATFIWNTQTIDQSDFGKTLEQLGARTDGVNVLSAIKAATGAC